MNAVQHEPTELLLDLIFAALDVGLEAVRESGAAMTPVLLTPGGDRPARKEFPANSLDESINAARAAAASLPPEVASYAIVADGLLPNHGEGSDAIIVEASQRGEQVGFIFAQRYRPERDAGRFEVSGRPTIIREVPNGFDR